MCGIFGYVGSGNATKIVFDGLKNLEYRGYDSWGIVSLKEGSLTSEKHVGKIGSSQVSLDPSHLALGHTRWATHGGVTLANSHPHFDCQADIAVVHNGIIENYLPLKKRLIAQGHHFTSQTDTEVIAHLIEQVNKKLGFAQAVKHAFRQIKGLNTVVALHCDGTIVAHKHGSPLVLGIDSKQAIYLSSDLPSLLDYTNRVAILQDHEVLEIKDGKLLTHHQFTQITMSVSKIDKGEYPHYYLKEINDQPLSLNRIVMADQTAILKARKYLVQAKHVYVIGCGTAYYAMFLSTYLLAIHQKIQVTAIPANEFASFIPLLNRQSVVMVASQSGETIDSIEAIRASRSCGAKTIGLINVPGSTLSRELDLCISLLAGVEKAVVSSKAYTNMLAGLYLISGLKNQVLKASIAIKTFLQSRAHAKQLKTLARKLCVHQTIFVIGRGINYPLALEGALKLKEISYLHAEALAAGELKHGVIALVEEGTPVFVVVANDSEKDAVLSSAMELKARGAWIIGIGPTKESVFDDWIKVADLPIVSPLLNVIPFQMLGYYLALEKKLDPDMPRNLAKSVTVK